MVEILQVFNREHTPHIKQQIVHPFDVCFQSLLHYNRACASNALKECEICDVFFNNHEKFHSLFSMCFESSLLLQGSKKLLKRLFI
jgi:hypothetical protein